MEKTPLFKFKNGEINRGELDNLLDKESPEYKYMNHEINWAEYDAMADHSSPDYRYLSNEINFGEYSNLFESDEEGKIAGITAFDLARKMWEVAPEELKSPSADMVMHDAISNLLKSQYAGFKKNKVTEDLEDDIEHERNLKYMEVREKAIMSMVDEAEDSITFGGDLENFLNVIIDICMNKLKKLGFTYKNLSESKKVEDIREITPAEKKILNAIKTCSDEYTLDDIQLWTTPKGNINVRTRDGRDIVTIAGLDEDDIEDLRLNGYYDAYTEYTMNEELEEI